MYEGRPQKRKKKERKRAKPELFRRVGRFRTRPSPDGDGEVEHIYVTLQGFPVFKDQNLNTVYGLDKIPGA